MQVNPYLIYDGNCQEALKFYQKVLGARIEATHRYREGPPEMQVAPEHKDRIMHARLTIDGEVLMASDAYPGNFQKPQGFSIAIALNDATEAERIFKALSENGKVQMPLEETFWALRFGYLIDRFGVPWMINCEKSA